MSIFQRIINIFSKPVKQSVEQAVLIHLDGVGLSPEIYENNDLATLEDQLIEALKKNEIGEFDGNEIGGGEAIIFLYGPDAEKIFAEIEAVLRSYPLCQNARIIIRFGPPGAPQREVRIS